jgi:signal transduction histidine kinase
MATVLKAIAIHLIHWDATNCQATARFSVPDFLSDEDIAHLLPWLTDIQDSSVELLKFDREFPQHHWTDNIEGDRPHPSPSAPHLSTSSLSPESRLVVPYLYGCTVLNQASSADYLVVGMEQPLSPHQESVLSMGTSGLRQIMRLEQDIQRQQAKVMLLEQVIQKASHQARHPLALIELYADVLINAADDHAVRSHVPPLLDAATDLGQQIDELADCGLQSKLKLEWVNVHTLWAESLNRVRPWIDDKNLKVVNPSSPADLWCDRWQISQVFDNVLHNAIHFSPPGGTLWCHWQRFQGEMLIEISDQGPGIPEEDLQAVFLPFYSKREGGTGIGLAIVRKIVLDHQGQCWMQNLPKGGAKFSFTLKC